MKKLLITALAILLATTLIAQRYKPGFSVWLGAGAAFASGASHGLVQKTTHHWPEFSRRFPNANPAYWNPAESWRSKYVGGDPEQGRVKIGPFVKPVQLTDFYHLGNTISIGGAAVAGGAFTWRLHEKRPWWHYCADAAIIFGARSAGNWLGWRGLYRT